MNLLLAETECPTTPTAKPYRQSRIPCSSLASQKSQLRANVNRSLSQTIITTCKKYRPKKSPPEEFQEMANTKSHRFQQSTFVLGTKVRTPPSPPPPLFNSHLSIQKISFNHPFANASNSKIINSQQTSTRPEYYRGSAPRLKKKRAARSTWMLPHYSKLPFCTK